VKRLKISEAEWVIMKVLWNNEGRPLTLGDIVKQLENYSDWSYTTIRTLIIRLCEKSAVTIDKTTGIYKYAPAINREDCVKDELKSFISRVFDNSPSKYIAALVSDGEITESEKKEILRILKTFSEE